MTSTFIEYLIIILGVVIITLQLYILKFVSIILSLLHGVLIHDKNPQESVKKISKTLESLEETKSSIVKFKSKKTKELERELNDIPQYFRDLFNNPKLQEEDKSAIVRDVKKQIEELNKK